MDLFRSCLLLLIAILLTNPGRAADPQDAQETDTPSDAPSNKLPDRQPGDDAVRPAEPVRPVDSDRTEALTWYMKGVEAEQKDDPEAALKAYRQAAAADPSAAEPVRAEALLLLRLGQTEEGIQKARRAVELDRGDFRTRFQLASILLRRQPIARNLPEALRLMDEALASPRLKPTDPEFILIHSVRGRILLQLQQNAKAAESYAVLLQALERPEDFGLDFRRHQALLDDRMTGYEAVGEALLAVGRTEEAIRAFEALVRREENRPGRHHLLLATALFRINEIERAEENLERYFESGRREKQSLELLSRIYSATSRSSRLIDRLKSLRDDTPDQSVVDLFRAEVELQQGRIDQAIATLEQVIIESGDPAAWPGLIRVDILRGDGASLVRNLQKALRARVQLGELVPFLPEITNDPEFARQVVQACLDAVDAQNDLYPEVTFVCAQIAQEIQADEQMVRLLQETLNRNPAQSIGQASLRQLGLHYLQNGQGEEAAGMFRRLLVMRSLPQQARIRTLASLARAESLAGRHDQALEAIQAAMQLQADDPELFYWLGWIQLNADRIEESRRALQESIRLAEQLKLPGMENSARLLLAMACSQTRDWDACIEQYRHIIAHPTDDEDMHRRARLLLSAVLVEAGRVSEAEAVLEELYAERPDDPGVNNDLGYLYADQNRNLEKALDMIRLAVQADPQNRAYLDSLGWVLYRLERFDEAREALEKANADPDFQDATLQEHLGDVYDALQRPDDARRMWQQALQTEEASDQPSPDVVKRLRMKLKHADAAASDKDSPAVSPAGENTETPSVSSS